MSDNLKPPHQTTVICPHCGDETQQKFMLPEFTCGECDRPFLPAVEDWATIWARHLVAKWEHGDEAHRQWLRDIATSDIAWALRHASRGRTGP